MTNSWVLLPDKQIENLIRCSETDYTNVSERPLDLVFKYIDLAEAYACLNTGVPESKFALE